MRRHGRDLVSLFFGGFFAAVAVIYLLAAGGAITVDGRWGIPAILVVLGGVGLVASLRPQRNDATTIPTGSGSDVD